MAEAYDKTEPPTLRRREEARRRGQVARSADLASAAVLLAAVAMMQSAGPKLLVSLRLLMQQALSEPTLQFTRPQLLRFASLIAQSLLPLLGVVVLVAAVVNALQFGLLFRFRLNEEAFDMAKGFDRLFSPRSRVRVVLDLVKLLAVGWVSYILVHQGFNRIASLSQLDASTSLAGGMSIVFDVAVRIAGLLLVLGLLDYGYQRWQLERDLRMTRREVKDELRDMEGDPKAKQHRRRMNTSLIASRFERNLSLAHVLVTHENQLAVAIRYEREAMDKPLIVAKGAGAVVSRLREAAAGEGILIVEQEPLARALYKQIDVGGEIPRQLYSAVAQVLAFAAAIRRGGA